MSKDDTKGWEQPETNGSAAAPAGELWAGQASDLLRRTFGYDAFRPMQREVIENVMARRDTLAVMPTGGGKSLCYQLPALLFKGLTVVVSPLIALMKDQVEQMQAAGVPARLLNSAIENEAYLSNMAAVRRGEVKLLYVAPESLLTPRLFELLDAVRVDGLVIDEAHCISEWGHDFRPEYRQLVAVRKRYPRAVCLALTATATPRVRDDIESALAFERSNRFVAGFDRENLFIEVQPKDNAEGQLLDFVAVRKQQSGIVYGRTRRQVERVAALLRAHGHAAAPYHAGLSPAERHRNQEAFLRDDVRIVAATIAFGMGINKPNVRFIVHYDLPRSLEGYYQEIGRAGRDGLPAHCLLLYRYADAVKLRYFFRDKKPEERQLAERHLQAIVRYAEDARTCRRKTLLGYFGETWTRPGCARCDHCAPRRSEKTVPGNRARIAPPPAAAMDYDQELLERLRVVRRTLAHDTGVPPYVVSHNRTLVELSVHYPQSRAELAGISGFGAVKLDRYGGVFLDAIRDHCARLNLAERSTPAVTASSLTGSAV